MPLLRRRPLLRAAMVGGAGYYAGKRMQRSQEREYEQDQQIADLQAQAQAPAAMAPPPPPAPAPAPPPPAPSRSTADRVAALTQLKTLLDDGVLTQEEFESEKQKILQES